MRTQGGLSRAAFAFSVCLLGAASAAHAQAPDAKRELSPADQQVRQHFEDGTKAFNLGEFDRAVKEYRAAYNVKADPVLLYNIAQSYRLGGNLRQALFFYRSYLNNVRTAPNRREVERRITDLEQQVEKQNALTTAPPNTIAKPDQSPSYGPEPEATSAPAPAVTTPPPAAAAVPASPAPNALTITTENTTEKRSTPVYKKWWLWTIVGVAAAGVAVGVGVGVGTSVHSPPSSVLGVSKVF